MPGLDDTHQWMELNIQMWSLVPNMGPRLGARPTNGISIEFKIWSKFGVLWFKIYLTNHNGILHTSQQLHCRDVCTISLWSLEYILNQNTTNFGHFQIPSKFR